ncbi:YbaB/EbfC family nucleoid-associated protein [Sulfobacillus thermosulfidooxidans]|uniref:YbaB/EbfC family nucleoid-associated protein n=1 Tax=Sulfobacillus thermosulfidooxidans TaxID=28034 RepID=UPI0006B41850|nr:YbaB/EbfC family nucleoid-associated protein [Sulfobacillus thermosulfidooxidans]
MGFNPNNMQKMMKQVQKMQQDMARVQEELQYEMVEVETGGVVKAVFNGHGEIQSITIQPEAVDPSDVEMLQDLILAAVREGQKKAQELASSRLNDVTKGMNLPNIPGLM